VIATFILALTYSVYGEAFEVDNFTQRYDPLPDVKAELNQEVNRRLLAGVRKSSKAIFR
jgi:hypothetical protein